MKEKGRVETNKNEKGLVKKNSVIEYLDLVLLMNKSKEETKRKKETKTRNQKKQK